MFLKVFLALGAYDFFVYDSVPSNSLSSPPHTSTLLFPFPPHQKINSKMDSEEKQRSLFGSIHLGFT